MDEKILNYIYRGLEHSNQAFFFYLKTERTSLYANKKALSIFGNKDNKIDVHDIFEGRGASEFLRTSISEELSEKGTSTVYDVPVTTKSNSSFLADVQVAYADEENEVLMVELSIKEDNRMDVAISQVNQSTRAEGILHFDEKLSLIHCNDLFHDVFESNEEMRHSHYDNNFSNGFQSEIRDSLLQEIHLKLKEDSNFVTKMKVITSKGIEKWYSLELQRRTLDDSGTDKLMAYLINIESQVEIEKQFDDINRYFTVLQSMYRGMIYRFDIKNRILYRTLEIADSLDLPTEGITYPNREQIQRVIHPDDLDEYMIFIEKIVNGEEGSLDSRITIKDGHYEYHRMTSKALKKTDGTVEEMIGLGQNVDSIRQTEEQLDSINQYFSALQNLSDDMLYRVDLSSKTLYRTSEQAQKFGIKPIMPNYPYSILESGIIHPEDEENYLGYGEKLLKGISSQVEVRLKTIGGQFEYNRLTCYPVYGPNADVKEMFGKIVNIQMVRELEEQANYDSLTKLLNKRAMLEYTSKVLEQATKSETHALFFMDLDDFKYVNDNLGHAFGDFLLSELGKRLRESVRQLDFVGRVGGDEFVVFLRDVPSLNVVLGKGKMILSTISEDFFDGKIRHTMHGSVGVAVYPDHGTSYEELYHHADIALYQSKNSGKNTITVYEPQ